VHHCTLSKIIYGTVQVAVWSSLPVKGVTMILGNDLAGDKICAEPCVVSQSTLTHVDAHKTDALYLACTVTQVSPC